MIALDCEIAKNEAAETRPPSKPRSGPHLANDHGDGMEETGFGDDGERGLRKKAFLVLERLWENGSEDESENTTKQQSVARQGKKVFQVKGKEKYNGNGKRNGKRNGKGQWESESRNEEEEQESQEATQRSDNSEYIECSNNSDDKEQDGIINQSKTQKWKGKGKAVETRAGTKAAKPKKGTKR